MTTRETLDTRDETRAGRAEWMTGDGHGALRERPIERTAVARRHGRAVLGLGWLSIGLGAAQLIAPRGVARLIGVRRGRQTTALMRALGAREVASGVAILRGRRPGRWVWARVAGDAIDLALLGSMVGSRRVDQGRLAAASAAVAGVTILDVLAARRIHIDRQTAAPAGVEVSRSITINKEPEEIYRFWRALPNLPKFMAHLESVETLGDRRSRWTVRGPVGLKIEWEAEIVEDRPGERIAWRSLEGADVKNSGEVRFVPAPGGRGTEVHVALRYDAPAGAVGQAIAVLFGKEPAQQIQGDLRRLKQVIETGEVVHSDASIHRGPHPGRPAGSTVVQPPKAKGGV